MRLFYTVVIILIITSCSQKKASKPSNEVKIIAPKTVPVGATDPKTSSLNGASMVNSVEIDSPMLKINYFVVSKKDYLVGEVVALGLTLPEKADYAEILRCPNNTSFTSGNKDLVTTVLTVPSAEDEAKIMREHNFWSDVVEQCDLLTPSGFRGQFFHDLAAKSGSYRYLTRACVHVERLKDSQYSNRPCSKMVSLSSPIDYQNDRKEGEKKALSEVQQQSSIIDGIGRKLYYLTTQINFAYTSCEKAEEAREAGLKRKQAFITIMAKGLSLSSSILTPESDLSSLLSSKDEAMTVKDLLTKMWGNKEADAPKEAPAPAEAPKSNMLEASQLGQALSWLSSSAADYPKSCTAAEKLARDANEETSKLKESHRLYLQALAEYALAKKQALGK